MTAITFDKPSMQRMIDLLHRFWRCEDGWLKCMKDENIELPNKYLLNGVRFVYSSYVAGTLSNKINGTAEPERFIKVIPTGSHNVSSDIDTQIMVNLCNFKNVHNVTQLDIIDTIVATLEEGNAMWGVKSLAVALDINLYPATLLNYISDCRESYCPKKLFINEMTNAVCFKPFLDTPGLMRDFINRDYAHTQQTPAPDMFAYYKKYKEFIAPRLCALAAKCTPSDDDGVRTMQIHNDNILGLVFAVYGHSRD